MSRWSADAAARFSRFRPLQRSFRFNAFGRRIASIGPLDLHRFTVGERALTICMFAALSACDDSGSNAKDEPVTAAAETAPHAAKDGGEDLDPIAKLAGTWIFQGWHGDDPDEAPWGMKMLWEIDGSVLTESNGVTVLKYDLKRLGPCLIRAKRQDKNSASTRAVLFDGEQMLARTGGFDSPDGRFVHVCDQLSARYLRVERGKDTCVYLSQQLLRASTTCTVIRHDEEQLVIDRGDASPLKLTRTGDLWLETKPGGSRPAKRYPDKDAAMAVLAAGR